ncbi:hypothetical protein JHW43_007092 [Diplocarpon mali]|nr:hypothetical protein JHW43_007092 [Diplocarpon mali]
MTNTSVPPPSAHPLAAPAQVNSPPPALTTNLGPVTPLLPSVATSPGTTYLRKVASQHSERPPPARLRTRISVVVTSLESMLVDVFTALLTVFSYAIAPAHSTALESGVQAEVDSSQFRINSEHRAVSTFPSRENQRPPSTTHPNKSQVKRALRISQLGNHALISDLGTTGRKRLSSLQTDVTRLGDEGERGSGEASPIRYLRAKTLPSSRLSTFPPVTPSQHPEHTTEAAVQATTMQLKTMIVLSLSSLAGANIFDSMGDGASSLGHAASSLAASLSSEYTHFTATATGGAAASSYVASLESAGSAALASVTSNAATVTGATSHKIVATTVTTTNAQGMTVTSVSLSTGGAAMPTGAVGAMLLGGAAVFAAVL